MKKLFAVYILILSFSVLACSNNTTPNNVNTNQINSPANAPQTSKDEKRNANLEKQFEQIASASKGHVGVMATILETGETASLNAKEHFPMQSVYKFPIGMAVLKDVDAGKLKIDQNVRVEKSEYVRQGLHSPIRDKNPDGVELSLSEILRYAVSESDGTASDVLMRLVGGAEPIDKFLKELGVNDLIVLNTEKELSQNWETQYKNWSSPEAAVALLRILHEKRELSESSQALLVKLMTETPTGMKRLKGQLPAGTVVVHKTGTSGTKDGLTAATNDIGIINLPNGKHLAIAVFVSDSTLDDAGREETIAKLAKATWDTWSK